MFVTLWYVLHPGTNEFFRCELHDRLAPQFFVLGPELDHMVADVSYTTLAMGGRLA